MSRFHEHLYNLVLEKKPKVMVETGYATGLSAIHILAAMDINGIGKLWSVECFTNQDLFHPRFNYVRGETKAKLVEVFAASGPWDIFLHDSDHEAGCQTFEYEMAWGLVRPGGVIMTDDYEWGTHRSWEKFLARHGITENNIMGTLAWFTKPADAFPAMSIQNLYTHAAKTSNEVCRETGAQPYFPNLKP